MEQAICPDHSKHHKHVIDIHENECPALKKSMENNEVFSICVSSEESCKEKDICELYFKAVIDEYVICLDGVGKIYTYTFSNIVAFTERDLTI